MNLAGIGRDGSSWLVMWFILRNSDLYTNRLETKQKAAWPKGSRGRHLRARDAPPVISICFWMY